MTKSSLINVVFGGAILLLVVMVGVGYRVETRLEESNRWTLHTYQVLETLEKVHNSLTDAETSRRGYILTGNANQMQQYEAASKSVPEQLAAVKRLTADNPVQHRRLSDLSALIDRKLANLKNSVISREKSGYRIDEQARMTEEGTWLMSAIRTGIDDIKNEERMLLNERRSTEREVLNSLVNLLWTGFLSAGLMITAAFSLARREALSHKKTAYLLREKSDALEAANRDITEMSAMTELLQSSSSITEAGKILSAYGEKFFRGDCGGIYLMNASRNLVVDLAVWGGGSEEPFAPEECWSLRRGQPHLAQVADVCCTHIGTAAMADICIPLAAQHETLGILHVGLKSAVGDSEIGEKKALAVAMAEQVGLALRNLQLREQLREMSIRDALTGLLNRRYMQESLLREISRAHRNKLPLSVVMLDVDHFKTFNDRFGHEAGDFVLKEFGYLLKKLVRESDIACRYGGEEFTLIMPEADTETAFLRAEEIREAVKKLQLVAGAQSLGMVTISAGVAVFPHHGETGDRLLSAADTALYSAKQQGRDRVVLFGKS